MPMSTNKLTRAIATRKSELARSHHPYSERVQPITDALRTLGGRATPAELFAKLRTGEDGLFAELRRIPATWRQYVRKMEHPPYVFDGEYFVLTKRQRRISSSKSKRSKSSRKLTRGPGIDAEVDDLVKAIEERSTGRSPRQGFNLPVGARRAIEDLAMKRATAHFDQQGWKVEDVHTREPYDLRCTKRRQELRVEVKGTSGAGKEIVLTRNEVEHARRYPNVALYVLAEVVWKSTRDRYRATGGREFIDNRWSIDSGKLKPLAYRYKLPEIPPDRSQDEAPPSRP